VGKSNQPQRSQHGVGISGQLVSLQTVHTQHSGPLPDPETLQRYENAIPGAADRIFKMAEKEQTNRHDHMNRELKAKFLAVFLGQTFAFLLGLCGILSGAYLVVHDKSVYGLSFFIASLGGLCGIYFVNRQKQSAETTSPASQSNA
jgi:uncharacterized membrane protein